MCSGALINPKHDTPLYFETYRSQNKLHIPMRIDTPYQLENYFLSKTKYHYTVFGNELLFYGSKGIYGLVYLVIKYFDCIRYGKSIVK